MKILVILDQHKSVKKPQIYNFFKFFTSTKTVSYHCADVFIFRIHKEYYLLVNC